MRSHLLLALLIPTLAVTACRSSAPAPVERATVGDLPEIRYYEIADT